MVQVTPLGPMYALLCFTVLVLPRQDFHTEIVITYLHLDGLAVTGGDRTAPLRAANEQRYRRTIAAAFFSSNSAEPR